MDYERALEESKECLRKASKFTHCTIFTVVSLTSLEKLDEATRVYTEAVSRIPNFTKAVKAIAPRPPQLAERYWSALNRVAPHVFVVSTSAH